MRCDELADTLAGAADGTVALDPVARRHVERCLNCQAQAVQYRRLLRALHALRTEVLEPAPGLLPDLLASLSEAGERHALKSLLTGRRVRYLGGIAAAATAAGAGAIVLASRSHRRRWGVAG